MPPDRARLAISKTKLSVLAASCLALQAGTAWPELPWPAGHAAETAAGGGVYTSPVSVTDQTATDQPVVFRADLVPALSIPVYAGQAGIVVQIAVQPGDQVAAGDTLARLDDRLPRLEHEAAALVLAQARARLARFRPAWDRRLISAQELEQCEYQARLAELRCAEVALVLERTVLVAPAAGMISEHRLLPGQPVAVGQECFRVEDPADLSAELAVPVAILGRVRRGQAVLARLTDPSGAPVLVGRLERISRAVDPASGGCLVTVRFPGAGALVRPGTPVQIILGKE